MYRMTVEDIEDYMEKGKSALMAELVRDDVMTADEADEWCNCHAVLVRKYPTFERLKKRLGKSDGHHHFIVVKAAGMVKIAKTDDNVSESATTEEEREQ